MYNHFGQTVEIVKLLFLKNICYEISEYALTTTVKQVKSRTRVYRNHYVSLSKVIRLLVFVKIVLLQQEILQVTEAK